MNCEKVPLKYIANISAGQSAPKDEYFSDGVGIPFIRAGHLQKLINGFNINALPLINEDSAKKCGLKLIPKHTVLFAKSGMSASLDRVYLTTSEAYFVSHLASVFPKNGKLHPGYCKYFFQWFKPSKLIKDPSYPSIGLQDINNIEIPSPSYSVQQKIASILDKGDELRLKDQQLLLKYDELLQSIFYQMFGDPVLNEKGWETVILKDLFTSNPRLGTVQPVSENGDLPVVRVGELGHMDINILKCKKVSLSEADKKRFLLSENDILLARAIGSQDHLGKASIVRNITQEMVFDSHVMRLQFDPHRINSLFFYHWLGSHGGRKIFLKNSGQTAVQFNINGAQISGIKINLPDIKIQNEFVKISNLVEQQKKKIYESAKHSESLFQSLLQKAFKGELIS